MTQNDLGYLFPSLPTNNSQNSRLEFRPERLNLSIVDKTRSGPPRYACRYPNVNHTHKFIFIHPPKCGGKSLEFLLFGRKPIAASADHRNIRTHVGELGWDVVDEYFKFAFVRNPYDRLVSIYLQRNRFLKRSGHASSPTFTTGLAVIPNPLSFKSYVKSLADPALYSGRGTPGIDAGGDSGGKGLFADRLMADYLSHNDDLFMNFIGRMENYEKDWEIVSQHLFGCSLELPHLNKSERSHYRDYYDDTSRKIVGRLYEKDIDLFKYTF